MALFQPGRIGSLELPNRIVMAPLGRARNHVDTRAPQSLSAEYYTQRASAGLIISEATHVSPGSVSRPGTGGVHSAGQVLAWREVTEAVHAAGGRIFQQLFHLGRKADPARLPGGRLPVAPSAVAAIGTLPVADGSTKPFPVPRALTRTEIAGLYKEFTVAFANARAAGFDGIELHAANGFLIEQFLRDDSNLRTDDYGGSIENRARFLLELVDTAIAVFGAHGVGIRISPHFTTDGPGTSDAASLYGHVASELGARGVAYFHVIEPDATPDERKLAAVLKQAFAGPFILAGEFTRDSAASAIKAGRADFVAFGRAYIANPDLVERFHLPHAPLNVPDVGTFYAGGAEGYTSYPTLQELVAPAA